MRLDLAWSLPRDQRSVPVTRHAVRAILTALCRTNRPFEEPLGSLGSEIRTSCHDLVVLVNQAAEAVPPPNAGGCPRRP